MKDDASADYVLKSTSGYYVRTLRADGNTIEYWTLCQHCAHRFTRAYAHGLHVGTDSVRVVRVIPRPRP